MNGGITMKKINRQKSIKKKTTILSLASALAISLSACGKENYNVPYSELWDKEYYSIENFMVVTNLEGENVICSNNKEYGIREVLTGDPLINKDGKIYYFGNYLSERSYNSDPLGLAEMDGAYLPWQAGVNLVEVIPDSFDYAGKKFQKMCDADIEKVYNILDQIMYEYRMNKTYPATIYDSLGFNTPEFEAGSLYFFKENNEDGIDKPNLYVGYSTCYKDSYSNKIKTTTDFFFEIEGNSLKKAGYTDEKYCRVGSVADVWKEQFGESKDTFTIEDLDILRKNYYDRYYEIFEDGKYEYVIEDFRPLFTGNDLKYTIQ